MRLIDADAVCERCRKSGSICTGNDCEIPAMPTLTPPNEWISVEERLPEESDGMVLLTNGKIVISGYRNQLFGLDGKQGVFAPSIKRGGGYMQVTYWMHLPEPPGKEKNR